MHMEMANWEAISWTISFVNAFGFVEVPINTCGFTSLITDRRSE